MPIKHYCARLVRTRDLLHAVIHTEPLRHLSMVKGPKFNIDTSNKLVLADKFSKSALQPLGPMHPARHHTIRPLLCQTCIPTVSRLHSQDIKKASEDYIFRTARKQDRHHNKARYSKITGQQANKTSTTTKQDSKITNQDAHSPLHHVQDHDPTLHTRTRPPLTQR